MKQIFIGGCQRSGTTMLGSLLGETADGVCIPESVFISQVANDHPDILKAAVRTKAALSFLAENKRFRVWRLDLARFERRLDQDLVRYSELIEQLILFYSAQIGKPNPRYWVDHTPANLRNASTLLKMFPNGRMIHIIRDGRAVASSLLKVDWGPNTIPAAARFWLEALAHCFSAEYHWGSGRITRVKYEDILREPETQLRNLCDFCGIVFHPSMLEGSSHNPALLTLDQHRLVGSSPDSSRALSWRHELSPRQIEIFECVAGDVLNNLGYETVYWPQASPHRSIERYRLDVKEFIYREVVNRWKTHNRFRRALCNKTGITKKPEW